MLTNLIKRLMAFFKHNDRHQHEHSEGYAITTLCPDEHDARLSFDESEAAEVLSNVHAWGYWKLEFAKKLIEFDADANNIQVRHALLNMRVAQRKFEDLIKKHVSEERIDPYCGVIIKSLGKNLVDLQLQELGANSDRMRVVAEQSRAALKEYIYNVRRPISEDRSS